MRILISIICLCIVNVAYAKVEVRLKGGLGINSRAYHKFERILPQTADPVLHIAVAGDVLYDYKKWQFGVGLHVQKMSSEESNRAYVYGSPAYIISAIANRKINNMYVGIGLGYLTTPKPSSIEEKQGSITTIHAISGNGFNANVHIGYSVYFGKFSINGQLNGNCAFIKSRIGIMSGSNVSYSIWYPHYSVQAGIGYRLL